MHTPLPIVPLPAANMPTPGRPLRPVLVAYRIGEQRHERQVQAEDAIDALLQVAALDARIQLGSARPLRGPALGLVQG